MKNKIFITAIVTAFIVTLPFVLHAQPGFDGDINDVYNSLPKASVMVIIVFNAVGWLKNTVMISLEGLGVIWSEMLDGLMGNLFSGLNTIITITDALGRELYTSNIGNTTSANISIPIKSWINGLYYLTIENSKESITKKIIKQ